jgi:hypothetical protein
MMGPVKGNFVDAARFGLMVPSKVLYDFDGQRTFRRSTSRSRPARQCPAKCSQSPALDRQPR